VLVTPQALRTAESDNMTSVNTEELSGYAEKLRTYSLEDLEDIYFNIHILRHPLKYRLVRMELEKRNVALDVDPPTRAARGNFSTFLSGYPFIERHPIVKAAVLWLMLFGSTLAVTLGMLSPIWLCAIPLHFLGLQTAIVYFACLPLPLIMGAAIGGKLGGRGLHAVPVLFGVAAAIYLFDLSGAPSAIIRSVTAPSGPGGGFSFGGGF